MARDQKIEAEKAENDFKNTLFASNPELFNTIYNKPEEEEFEIQEFVPESEQDVQNMLAQLKREGVID